MQQCPLSPNHQFSNSSFIDSEFYNRYISRDGQPLQTPLIGIERTQDLLSLELPPHGPDDSIQYSQRFPKEWSFEEDTKHNHDDQDTHTSDERAASNDDSTSSRSSNSAPPSRPSSRKAASTGSGSKDRLAKAGQPAGSGGKGKQQTEAHNVAGPSSSSLLSVKANQLALLSHHQQQQMGISGGFFFRYKSNGSPHHSVKRNADDEDGQQLQRQRASSIYRREDNDANDNDENSKQDIFAQSMKHFNPPHRNHQQQSNASPDDGDDEMVCYDLRSKNSSPDQQQQKNHRNGRQNNGSGSGRGDGSDHNESDSDNANANSQMSQQYHGQESCFGLDPSKQRFQYVLAAPISAATKLNEDTMTYLNQSQAYEIKLGNTTDVAEARKGFMCSIINIGFHERHMQQAENELWQQWSQQHPNEKIFSVDMKLSYNVYGVDSDGLNKYEFLWDSSKAAGVFIRINSISTEFTPKKHGGEKGVPFRLSIETFSYNSKTHDSYFISAASCQIKVFKPKGAERKLRSDRDKIYKRPPSEQDKYHRSCDHTTFGECSLASLHPMADSSLCYYRHSHGHFASKQVSTSSAAGGSASLQTNSNGSNSGNNNNNDNNNGNGNSGVSDDEQPDGAGNNSNANNNLQRQRQPRSSSTGEDRDEGSLGEADSPLSSSAAVQLRSLSQPPILPNHHHHHHHHHNLPAYRDNQSELHQSSANDTANDNSAFFSQHRMGSVNQQQSHYSPAVMYPATGAAGPSAHPLAVMGRGAVAGTGGTQHFGAAHHAIGHPYYGHPALPAALAVGVAGATHHPGYGAGSMSGPSFALPNHATAGGQMANPPHPLQEVKSSIYRHQLAAASASDKPYGAVTAYGGAGVFKTAASHYTAHHLHGSAANPDSLPHDHQQSSQTSTPTKDPHTTSQQSNHSSQQLANNFASCYNPAGNLNSNSLTDNDTGYNHHYQHQLHSLTRQRSASTSLATTANTHCQSSFAVSRHHFDNFNHHHFAAQSMGAGSNENLSSTSLLHQNQNNQNQNQNNNNNNNNAISHTNHQWGGPSSHLTSGSSNQTTRDDQHPNNVHYLDHCGNLQAPSDSPSSCCSRYNNNSNNNNNSKVNSSGDSGQHQHQAYGAPPSTNQGEILLDLKPQNSITINSSCMEVVSWFASNRFGALAKTFSNFSGADLLRLSKTELIEICGLIEGIRLFNSLHNQPIKPRRVLYICLETEDIYHPIYLYDLSLDELLAEISLILESNGSTTSKAIENEDNDGHHHHHHHHRTGGDMVRATHQQAGSRVGGGSSSSYGSDSRSSSRPLSTEMNDDEVYQSEQFFDDEVHGGGHSSSDKNHTNNNSTVLAPGQITRLLVDGVASVKVAATEKVVQMLEDESVWTLSVQTRLSGTIEACITAYRAHQKRHCK